MSVSYQSDEVAEDESLPSAEAELVRLPPPYYTFLLVGAIAVVFVVQVVTGLENSTIPTAFDKQLFVRGEYWRILTGATVHGGLLHVLMNGYAFYSLGRIVEMLSNRAHVAIVFLLAAVGGGILSLVFMPQGSSVGASGGVLGLISYLAVYAFRRRQFISPEFRKSLLINIGFVLIFGLVLYQQIDNFTHIGGLLVGAVYGLIQIPSDEFVDPRSAGTAAEIVGLGALALFVAACGFSIVLMFNLA